MSISRTSKAIVSRISFVIESRASNPLKADEPIFSLLRTKGCLASSWRRQMGRSTLPRRRSLTISATGRVLRHSRDTNSWACAMSEIIGDAMQPVRLGGPDHEPLPFVPPATVAFRSSVRHRAGRPLAGLTASLVALALLAAAATSMLGTRQEIGEGRSVQLTRASH